MSALVLTLQAALLIVWGEYLSSLGNHSEDGFVGALVLVGMTVGVLAICRAWTSKP